jgi:hypothetical protein
MDRRRKVELFQEIRREHWHGAGSIRAVAKKLVLEICLLDPAYQRPAASRDDGLMEAVKWNLGGSHA